MAAKNWSDFPVAYPPPTNGWFDDGCLSLSEVTHVSHIKDAIRVIEDRRIRSALVYDECCLNTKRTQVSWVSPKTWANGYLYGNVAFAFDWAKLVEGKKVYWVEHRRTTGQDICRFLISDEDFEDHPLEEYDYTRPHGPLYFEASAKQWYHNNRVTSEYMILADLRLSQCKFVRFVKHHDDYCNKKEQGSCADLGRSDADAGAEVICKLIGAGQTYAVNLFESRYKSGEIDHSVNSAISMMYRRIVGKFNPDHTGKLPVSDRAEIMRAIMDASGWDQRARTAALLALFPDKASVEGSFYACLDEFFVDLKVSRH
jgi:hypothetical protein